jgi:cytidyltransferase-like protein
MKFRVSHSIDGSHFFLYGIEVPRKTYEMVLEQEVEKKRNATNSSMVVPTGSKMIPHPASSRNESKYNPFNEIKKPPSGTMTIKPAVIVIVSGGFDPIHVGHIRMFQEARELYPNSFLYAILNSDRFLLEKKGFVFMPFEEREEILQAIKTVDFVFPCVDEDQTVRESIRFIAKMWVGADRIVFANGGDRTQGKVPEENVCRELGIEMEWGVGGGKVQSSSDLVKSLHENKEDNA